MQSSGVAGDLSRHVSFVSKIGLFWKFQYIDSPVNVMWRFSYFTLCNEMSRIGGINLSPILQIVNSPYLLSSCTSLNTQNGILNRMSRLHMLAAIAL